MESAAPWKIESVDLDLDLDRSRANRLPRLPQRYVPRPRLDALFADQRLAVIHAGGGYGKTTLVAARLSSFDGVSVYARLAPGDHSVQLLSLRLQHALKRAGLSDLAGALDASVDPNDALDFLSDAMAAFDERILLAVDDAHYAASSASQGLRRLIQSVPPNVFLVVAARAVPSEVWGPSDDGLLLTEADLAFTLSETRAYLAGSDRDPAELHCEAQGWPTAVVLSSRMRRRGDSTYGIRALVDDHLAMAPLELRRALVQSAHLPAIDQEILSIIQASITLDQLRNVGLPMQVRDRGQAFLDPVAETLRDHGPLEPSLARQLAVFHHSRGHPLDGARTLAAAGLHDEAAALLAVMTPAEAATENIGELRAVVEALPAGALDAHPYAILHLVRGLELTFERAARSALITQLIDVVGDQPVTPIAREVLAERARDLVRQLDIEAAASCATRVMAFTDRSEDIVRARCLDVLAWTSAWQARDYAGAERFSQRAIAAARRTGVGVWVAEAYLTLALRVQHPAGAFDRAEASLREALALYAPRSARAALVLSFLADILIDVGRPAEAAGLAQRAFRLGRSTGSQQGAGYAAWSLARAMSATNDAKQTMSALSRVEQHPGDWFTSPSGPTFLADAACMLERVGEQSLADRYLARAVQRRSEVPLPVLLAQATLAVRRGTDMAGDLLQRAAAMDGASPIDQVRLGVLQAYAALRQDSSQGPSLATAVFERAAEIGVPGLALTVEPDLGPMLVQAAIRGGSRAARAASAAVPISLQVLGGFAVTRAGRCLDLPTDTAHSLVMLAAVRAPLRVSEVPAVLGLPSTVSVAVALDELQQAVPGMILSEGGWIRIAEDVRVDARQLLDAAVDSRRWATRDPLRAVLAARTVDGMYTGEVLPGVRAQWADRPRQRLRAEVLAALDLIAGVALEVDDLDEAIGATQRALEIDASDPDRFLTLAEMYLRQDRRARAAAALADAGSTATREGLGLTARHQNLARLLRLDAAQQQLRPAAVSSLPDRSIALRVLGRLEVVYQGRLVPLPAGHPTRLVTLLACAQGPVGVRSIIRSLWPDVEEKRGRGRLREALHRLTRAVPLVQRTGQDQLSFTPEVRMDLNHFQASARFAEAGGEGHLLAAREALEVYGGPLLPEHVDGDWIQATRVEVERRHTSLLNLLSMDQKRRAAIGTALRDPPLPTSGDPSH
ncbi:MAG: hypothetical protein ACR2HR_09505 [Euzebya sp.]